MTSELKNIVEALLLVADVPLSIAKIQGVFDKDSAPESPIIKQAIDALKADYAGRALEVKKIGSGYRLQTREVYADWIRKMQSGRPPRLSRAQLETLAMIAYRQPVTRGDIEEVRGVTVSQDIMQRLLEREWIRQVGVRDVPGRPALFGTTQEFLGYFNLESISDLPPLMEQRDVTDIARDLDMPLPADMLAALQPAVEEEIQGDQHKDADTQPGATAGSEFATANQAADDPEARQQTKQNNAGTRESADI